MAQCFRKLPVLPGHCKQAGIIIGETVTVCIVNGSDTVCLLIALNKTGAVVNMVYGADTSEELLSHLTDTHSTTVFTLNTYLNKSVTLANKANLKRIIVTNITMETALLTRLAAQLFKRIKPKMKVQKMSFLVAARYMLWLIKLYYGRIHPLIAL